MLFWFRCKYSHIQSDVESRVHWNTKLTFARGLSLPSLPPSCRGRRSSFLMAQNKGKPDSGAQVQSPRPKFLKECTWFPPLLKYLSMQLWSGCCSTFTRHKTKPCLLSKYTKCSLCLFSVFVYLYLYLCIFLSMFPHFLSYIHIITDMHTHTPVCTHIPNL